MSSIQSVPTQPVAPPLSMPTAQGDAWTTFFEFTSPRPDGPLSAPLTGLLAAVSWATPVVIDDERAQSAGVTVHPLYQVNDSDNIWAESEWLRYRYAFENQPFGAINMRTPPTPSTSRDSATGPWTIGATIERPAPDASGREPGSFQRMVLVSAAGWYQDPFVFTQANIDGRTVTRYPANAELIDASLFWLSDMDELIARSARVSDVSRIRELSSSQQTALKWAMIAGLPLVVLLVGAGLRILRG